jgi:hypothetical protein
MSGMTPFTLAAGLALDPANAWSIGSFGAIGEFMRDPDEPAEIDRSEDRLEIVTARGGFRLAPTATLDPMAWDTLSSDGETWGHTLAFCVPVPREASVVVRALGEDGEALREADRSARLFDLGVGHGATRMALRTADAALVAALEAAEGRPLLSCPAVTAEVLRAQPHRVMLSPAGRVEVYQPIPAPDGKSPVGPHTHLLPKLIAKGRPHSANVPIPDGWQSALTVHPASPWRDILGERHPYDADRDRSFAPLLERYGLADDLSVDARIRGQIADGRAPEQADWPSTRRGRIKARITLRRLAVKGAARVAAWRTAFDHARDETNKEEAA